MRSFRPLPRRFYKPSAKVVAPALLGHWLIRNTPNGPCGGPIVETEAYLVGDPACHGAPGPTARNRVMFGGPGHGYVYFIYGNYFCMNAVCQPARRGRGGADSSRGSCPRRGVHAQAEAGRCDAGLTNGPGKLCLAMDIDRRLDGVDLCDATLPAVHRPESRGRRASVEERGPVVTTTRIGLTKAADLPLRFYLEGSPFVSKRDRSTEAINLDDRGRESVHIALPTTSLGAIYLIWNRKY